MSDCVYERLRAFLDRMPGGFPSTDSGIEIRILRKLFAPDEAEITPHLNECLEEVSAIAKRVGRAESEISEKLEHMAREGLIFRYRDEGKTLYRANPFVPGLFEFHQHKVDREFGELMEQYMPHLGMLWATVKTKQLRVIPVDSALDALPAVAPYNQVREFVKKQSLISEAPCMCRREYALMEHKCDRPEGLCFSFGDVARYVIENGMGKQISVEEALQRLNLAEESALVLAPANSQEFQCMCCCCSCCCHLLKLLQWVDRPVDHFQSGYQATIDPELCTACGTCLERCQINAIKNGGSVMEIDPARCIGCGLCVSRCPAEAISFDKHPGVAAPPADCSVLAKKVKQERGLA
ncbi:4Fe-4S binding protein [Candidatus Poribacteria bacterium]|nr:4Fe-4S binding protein [Candidatus Poribacteria bacterium]